MVLGNGAGAKVGREIGVGVTGGGGGSQAPRKMERIIMTMTAFLILRKVINILALPSKLEINANEV
jgi:hypothetical protein